MNIFRLFGLLRTFLSLSIVEEGAGSTAEPPAAPTAAPAPPAAPAAAPAAAAPAEPKPTMLEAMFGKEGEPNNRGKGPRQVDGKFTTKVSTDATPPAPKPAKTPSAPAVATAPAAPAALAAPAAPAVAAPAVIEAKPDADDAMPEGLTPKAQERFQRLANTVKELTTKHEQVSQEADTAKRQVEYVKATFHNHAVRPEQFEQAAGLIGMLNKGDYEGARTMLEKQLQQIALITGKQGGTIDALANFPDLRQAVDNLQLTEAHAIELARTRAQQFAGEQQAQRDRHAQEQTRQTQAAVESGTKAVDALCKRLQSSDIDYPAIEAQLLPEIPNLIRGVHPSQWAAIVEANFRMLKSAAGKFRQSSTPAGNALRPTGQGSPATAPKTMYEAMFGA